MAESTRRIRVNLSVLPSAPTPRSWASPATPTPAPWPVPTPTSTLPPCSLLLFLLSILLSLLPLCLPLLPALFYSVCYSSLEWTYEPCGMQFIVKQIRWLFDDNSDDFLYFSIKTYTVGIHEKGSYEYQQHIHFLEKWRKLTFNCHQIPTYLFNCTKSQ